uniref:histidine kinase n=1 Tax=Magnetococcus massalia (strain MO-1) TaxID=451514 RepID=A0A1S7LJ20_MAGMO|nr:conserved protein of unknown function [Candidatus Magnetococcus massalia]
MKQSKPPQSDPRSFLESCTPLCRLLVTAGFVLLSLLISVAFFFILPESWSMLSRLSLLALGTFAFVTLGLRHLLYLPLRQDLNRNRWLLGNQATFNNRLRGLKEDRQLGETALNFLAETVDVKSGAIYLRSDESRFRLIAGYALSNNFQLGELINEQHGLVGEVIKTRAPFILEQSGAMQLDTGLGQVALSQFIALPLLNRDNLQGVMALGLSHTPSHRQHQLLTRVSEVIAIAFAGAQASVRMQDLLDASNEQQEELKIHQSMLKETIEKLEQTSKFKSRFLASMSHELRSPLNSLLILSKLLAENRQQNLTDKQVEFARTIHSAGTDLLGLIDEVLDLARIEAGRIRIYREKMDLQDLAHSLDRLYSPVAMDKKLGFKISMPPELPEWLYTDRQRVDQILKNLITNAIKFTESGSVNVTLINRDAPDNREEEDDYFDGAWIKVSVKDTGIGIPKDKVESIFEPFKQLDDGADRKYPGTGLGLAISQELTALLGGLMEVDSEEGRGSVFSLSLPVGVLPVEDTGSAEAISQPQTNNGRPQDLESIRDDRRNLHPEDRTILIIGHNHELVREQMETVRHQGFAAVVAGDVSSTLFLANLYQPIAIILTTDLPGVESHGLIKRLRGAVGHSELPILHLAVPGSMINEQVPNTRIQTLHLAGDMDLPKIIHTSKEFLQSLLPPAKAATAPTETESAAQPSTEQLPHASKGQSVPEAPQLKPVPFQPAPAKEPAHQAPLTGFEVEPALKSRKILIIEDDMRNIFALTSLLEESDAHVLMAKNGIKGLEMLNENQDVDIVLLDIMMPDMNGYDVLKKMREDLRFQNLPVIVLTAKALQGERKRCLAAGASDYLPKPLDPPKLLAMLRVWMEKRV